MYRMGTVLEIGLGVVSDAPDRQPISENILVCGGAFLKIWRQIPPTYIASFVTESSCPPPGLAATCGVKRPVEDQMFNGYYTTPLVEVKRG